MTAALSKINRVVVTRSQKQSESLAHLLRRSGFEPVQFPVIRFELIPQPARRPAEYDWLLFTSVNAVHFFFESGHDPAAVRGKTQIGAVGSATAKALKNLNLTIDALPEEFVGEKLVASLGSIAGQRILLPRAKKGRPEIVDLLRQKGAVVDEMPLYDTVTNHPSREQWADLAAGWDAVLFTSPSSVRNFVKLIQAPPAEQLNVPFADWLQRRLVACIGPVTEKQALNLGLKVDLVPEEYTIPALVKAIITNNQ